MTMKATELLMQPRQLNAFCQSAKKTAFEKFDSQLIIPQYEAYYMKVLTR